MKRLILVAVAALGFGMLAGPAYATNPHFVWATADLDGVNLEVSWKEAGLGDNLSIDYIASAQASATYVCVNKGGSNPSAANKTEVGGPVSASDTFSSGRNGQITQSLTIGPPGPGDFSCPRGQRLELAEVTYWDVEIRDVTNGISEPIAGTFWSGCLLPNVRGAC